MQLPTFALVRVGGKGGGIGGRRVHAWHGTASVVHRRRIHAASKVTSDISFPVTARRTQDGSSAAPHAPGTAPSTGYLCRSFNVVCVGETLVPAQQPVRAEDTKVRSVEYVKPIAKTGSA